MVTDLRRFYGGDAGATGATLRTRSGLRRRSADAGAMLSVRTCGQAKAIRKLTHDHANLTAHDRNWIGKLARSNDHAINPPTIRSVPGPVPPGWSPPIPLYVTNPNGDMEPNDHRREQTLRPSRTPMFRTLSNKFIPKRKHRPQKNWRDSVWPERCQNKD
jgi:hypothetical protein